jgi:hypothetical protein
MSDAGFVFAGWGIVAGAVGAYWLALVARTRRAERSRP